jgi:hypothetical protein
LNEENAEVAGCASGAHLAISARKLLKKHDRPGAHIAPFYLAIVR